MFNQSASDNLSKSNRSAIKASWASAFASWAQVVSALVSILLAMYAIQIANEFKEEDRKKDELLIRPKILFYTNAADGNLSLQNFGLGPAIIKRILINVGDRNTDLTEHGDASEQDRELFGIFFSKFFLLDQLDKFNINVKEISVQKDIPFPGSLIQKDTNDKIFTFNSSYIKDRSSVENYHKWSYNVVRNKLIGLSFQLCYCSLSEQSCFWTGLPPRIDQNSQLANSVKNCSSSP